MRSQDYALHYSALHGKNYHISMGPTTTINSFGICSHTGVNIHTYTILSAIFQVNLGWPVAP